VSWLTLLVLSGGCEQAPENLALADLSAAERQFVERYVVLERARAVSLADPTTGVTILDSLASAWSDTADLVAERSLSTDPSRAAAVMDLVSRLLEAEADSLVHAPLPRRLSDPLPRPVPPS
jgi:hypothetical protein